MYTQHPILTEKHRVVDIFADLLKKKNWNITWFEWDVLGGMDES